MSTNINSTEQIVEINAGDQITNVNIVSQSTTQVISGEQVVTIDTNAGTIPAAWGAITGTLSNQTDLQNALNLKQNNITLTTTGTTGVATLVGATLNIPNYVSSTKQTQWDSAYNDKINSAEVSGTTTKTLTLTQQDGGIIQASWSDFDTAPVTSVFGRTGDVVATEGDYNINQLGDVTITSATNGQVLKYNGTAWVNAADASGLTSVGLAMPSAFTVSGSPLTSNGTITVTGAGTTSQYVRGDGSLATFPTTSNEAKTLIREVYNKTGATLTKGTVIYIDGGQGNLPTVTKALATGDATSAQTFGIVQSDITNMNNGFVVVAGGIDNLDTQAYTEGTALYLSPTTAGAWTSTKPYAPQHIVYIGVVVRSHPTQGVIEVKIQNGYELDELHNVSARFPTNKDGIFYNSTSGVWENKSIAGVLGYTPVPESRIITINGTAQNLSADRTWNVGTVTQVAASGGTGISVAGSPVTGSGTITITNTAPDQVVGLTGAGTTSISGTYPNFTITSNDQYTGTVTSVAASGGTGISISGSPITSSGTINITNTAPDQIVSLTGSGTTSISGTYPNFTVTSNDQYVGTVTSVNATVPTGFEVSGVPITSSGTVDIKFASGYSLPTNAKQSEWDTAYTKRLDSLTVTGNSGSATLTSNVLNVPTYTLTGLGGEPAITAGTTLQYFRGDKTFQTLNTSVVPESGNVYFTEPRVRATVLSGLNITGGSISASDSVLNAFGKVQNQINGLIGGSIFQSTWNASTNTPSLASGVGTKGYYYIVSVAGTTNLDGITDWQIGDWAIFDGTVWRKVDNTDAVVSVNGYTGVVNLVLDDLADVSAASPTNAQLLRFNGTSSKWENWTPNYLTTITLTGDVTGTGTSSIATTIGAGKVTNAMLAGSIDYAKMNAATVPTWNQDTTGNAATADKWKTARTLTIGSTGKSVDGSGNVSWSLAEIGAQAALTDPVTGTGAANRIAYWSSASAITGSATFTFTPTSALLVNNSVTAASAIARGINFTPTLVAAANNDVLVGLDINPTFTNGSFTGVSNIALRVTGSATFSSTISASNFSGSSSGTNTGDQTITLTGDVTGSGTGSFTTTIANNAVTTAKINSGAVTAAKLATFGHNDAINWSANTDDAFIKFVSTGDGTGESALEIGTGDNGNERIRFTQRDGAVTYTRVYIDTDGELYKGGGTKYVYNTGTWDINTTGSAATLTTARNFTINGTAKSFNGSANVSWTAAEIGLTSYLPLTGGTLTGALSGTSATFSDIVTISKSQTGNTNTLVISNPSTSGTFAASAMTLQSYNGTSTVDVLTISATSNTWNYQAYGANSGIIYAGGTGGLKLFAGNASGTIKFYTAGDGTGNERLTISSTGAATFSSSVTASSFTANGSSTGGFVGLNIANASTGAAQINLNNSVQSWLVNIRTDNHFSIYNNTSSTTPFLINTSGNVGIGTASPSRKLDVVIADNTTYAGNADNANSLNLFNTSTTNETFSSIRLGSQGAGSAGIVTLYGVQTANAAGSGYFAISTRNAGTFAERMRITSGGNVGIGAASPQTRLQINDSGTGAYTMLTIHNRQARAAGVGARINLLPNNDFTAGVDTGAAISAVNSGGGTNNETNLIFETSFQGGGSEKMRITSGGNVLLSSDKVLGINTSDGSDTGYLALVGASADGETRGGLIYLSGNERSADAGTVVLQAGNVGTGTINFRTGAGVERMRITGGGNVGIGNNAPPSDTRLTARAMSSTQYNLFLEQDNGLDGYVMSCTSADGSLKFYRRDTSGTNTQFRMLLTAGGELLINTQTDSGAYYLQVNGSVYATAYYESSDIRLKDVLTNSYSENFSAIEFMWKDKRDDKKHWGYAAQDVMKYIPDAIEVNNDGMMTVNYNEAHTWKIAQLEAKIVELEAKLK